MSLLVKSDTGDAFEIEVDVKSKPISKITVINSGVLSFTKKE